MIRSRLQLAIGFVRRFEFTTLLLLGILAGGAWLFVEIADEVFENDTAAFDRAVLLALRNPNDLADPIGPAWVEEFGRDLTALGGVGFLVMLTISVACYLALLGKPRMMLFVLVAIVGGLLISAVLKSSFSRPRPDLVAHGSYVYTTSFPSGHSMMSAVTYLTLAALLARIQPTFRLKFFFLAVAVVLTVSVGVSRVYLGVHWPTDVLAGWSIGAVWASLCGLVARRLQRRGQVERAATPDENATGISSPR